MMSHHDGLTFLSPGSTIQTAAYVLYTLLHSEILAGVSTHVDCVYLSGPQFTPLLLHNHLNLSG
jgi:hypothetical protein